MKALTFLEKHVQQLVAIDFLVVPTVNFRLLFVFVVLAHQRRHAIHFKRDDASHS